MPELLAIARSMRRSYARRAVLTATAQIGRGGLVQIAERARLTPDRVHAVLYGKLPGFRHELALLALGLIREARDESGTWYETTPTGHTVVRSLRRGGLKQLVDGAEWPALVHPARAAAREASRAEEVDAPEAARAGVDLEAELPPACPHCGRHG